MAMLTVRILIRLAAFAAAAAAVGVDDIGEWENRAYLDSSGILTLWWNSTARDDNLYIFLLEGSTHGYLGLGLSPHTGTMAGADMVVAWIDGSSVAHIRDYWADQNGSPTLDALQDWRVLWSRENSSHTSVLLARPTVTGHHNDLPIEIGPMRLIYAWSEKDPDGAPKYHGEGRRGTVTLQLLSCSTDPHKNPTNMISFSIVLTIQLSLLYPET